MNYKKLGYILLILIGFLGIYQIVFAVPTSTILLQPKIPSLGSVGLPCLVVGTTSTLGLVTTSTCGGGGSVSTSSGITINNFPYWVTAGGGLSGSSTLIFSTNQTLSATAFNASGTITVNGIPVLTSSSISGTSPIVWTSGTGVISCAICFTSEPGWRGDNSFVWNTTSTTQVGIGATSSAATLLVGGVRQSATSSVLFLNPNATNTTMNIVNGSASGTVFGINTSSSFKGNLIDIQKGNSSSTFQITSAGSSTFQSVASGSSAFVVNDGSGNPVFQVSTNIQNFKFIVKNASGTNMFSISSSSVISINDIVSATGTTPTVSSCGTTPAITGTNFAGYITVGSGVINSCTMTFATTTPVFKSRPSCVINGESAILINGTVTTTTLTIAGTAIQSDIVNYICVGLRE